MGVLDVPGIPSAAVDVKISSAVTAAVTAALANKSVGITLVQGSGLAYTTGTLTALFGTPTYATGEKGANLTQNPQPSDITGVYTFEFDFTQAIARTGDVVLLDFSNRWIGITPAGLIYYNTDTTTFGPNLYNGTKHHIAIALNRIAGVSTGLVGIWIDGIQVASTIANSSTPVWPGWSVGGRFTSGGSAANTALLGNLRVSFGTTSRYVAGNFVVPTRPYTWDATTRVIAPLQTDLSSYVPGTGYPPRPSVAGGAVTYVGLSTPTDMLTKDRWYQI